MDIKKGIRPALPHIIAVALFIIISFAYFYPVLEGKVLKANDSTVSTINAKEIRDYREKFDEEPLWTNSIFSGMPAYLISVRFPGNLLKHADTILRIFRMPVSVLFLSMAGFYLLLLMIGVNPWLAIAGATGYGLSSFFFQILAAGHNTQAIALAYMAPMIGGIWYAYRKNAIKGAVFTAFVLSLEILANHPQITYYAMLCLLIFIITEFVYSVREKSIPAFLRTSALMIVPVLIAVGVNFGNLYTINEYGKYSQRGKSDLILDNKNVSGGLDRDYITDWSYGIDETMNLLIPDYKGGSSSPFDRDSETVRVLRQNDAGHLANQLPKYWGPQSVTDGPHYVGAIFIFLFILGLIIVKGREKWWLLVATLLSILLAWGKNFMPLTNLFIDYFPGYNKFRAVTMTLVISQFCIPLLGILALKELYNGSLSGKEVLKGVKTAGGITGGLLLLVLLIPGIAGSFISPTEAGLQLPDWLTAALVDDRKDLLRADTFRSLIFVVLSAAVIVGFLTGRLKKEYSVALLGLLIFSDLWSVDKRYLNAGRFERPAAVQRLFTPTAADEFILKDQSYHRVLNLAASTFNDNTPTSYFHKSIGGYHGAKLKRYKELIDSSIIRELGLFSEASQTAKTIDDFLPVFNSTPALNMLNTKYVIFNPDAAPIVNRNAMGNAWFAEKPRFVENANFELSAINSLDPSYEAVIDIRFKDLVSASDYTKGADDTISLISYQPNELVYKYSAEGEKLVVFSEIWYPAGWKCFIDDKESSYFRANYVLRSMVVPGGEHEIKFIFRPSSYFTGNKVSLASSIVLFLLIAGYFASTLIKKYRPRRNGSS